MLTQVCNVAIVDKHPIDALGVKNFLCGTEFRAEGPFDSIDCLLEYAREHTVEIVLSELDLPDALELPERLQDYQPSIAIVYFSSNRNPVMLDRAKRSCCAGALDKNIGGQELVRALRRVREHGSCWTRATSRQIVGALSAARVDLGNEAALTRREYSILQLVAEGKTNQMIAEEIGVSYETIKEHVQNVLRKLHLADRTQAAVWMTRQKRQPART